jgi:hypothetical protein
VASSGRVAVRRRRGRPATGPGIGGSIRHGQGHWLKRGHAGFHRCDAAEGFRIGGGGALQRRGVQTADHQEQPAHLGLRQGIDGRMLHGQCLLPLRETGAPGWGACWLAVRCWCLLAWRQVPARGRFPGPREGADKAPQPPSALVQPGLDGRAHPGLWRVTSLRRFCGPGGIPFQGGQLGRSGKGQGRMLPRVRLRDRAHDISQLPYRVLQGTRRAGRGLLPIEPGPPPQGRQFLEHPGHSGQVCDHEISIPPRRRPVVLAGPHQHPRRSSCAAQRGLRV